MTHSPDGASAGGLDEVERLSKVYAEATGYYVPFHGGLSSESSDKIRAGIRAVLRALSPSPGLGEEGVHLAPNVRGREPRSSVLTSTSCQSEERDRFEDWAIEDNRCVQPEDFEERVPENGCYYAEDSTNHAYIGWRERARATRWAALSSEAPGPKSEDQFPPVADQAVDALSVCERDECWFGGKCAGLCNPEGADVSVAVAQQRAQASSAQDTLIPPGFVVAPREVVERVAELESALRYAVGLLPGLAGAYDKPDNAVYSVMATKGEILKARAALPPPGGGKGAFRPDAASVIPVLAHLVATGQATDQQRAELLDAIGALPGGGKETYSTERAARIASDHAATAPQCKSEEG